MIVVHKNMDITEYVSSITWEGSAGEAARKLEISVVNAPFDAQIAPVVLGLADEVFLFEDDKKTELFRGFVVEREASSKGGTVSFTAYDMLFYTLKSHATYNFSGKTAEAITEAVCADLEIPVGELAQTGIAQKLIVSDLSIYEIITKAYENASQQSGQSYSVYTRKGLLHVGAFGHRVCDMELSEDSFITSSSYQESMENLINRVRIYDGEGNQSGTVEESAQVKRYGVFQATYTKEEGKDEVSAAKSLFCEVEKTFRLECVGYSQAVTGAGAVVHDSSTGLRGLVWIDADTHKWENGVHTMSLSLTLKRLMTGEEE